MTWYYVTMSTLIESQSRRIKISYSPYSLKTVQLRNVNEYLSIPIADTVNMKESHHGMKILLGKTDKAPWINFVRQIQKQ